MFHNMLSLALFYTKMFITSTILEMLLTTLSCNLFYTYFKFSATLDYHRGKEREVGRGHRPSQGDFTRGHRLSCKRGLAC